MAIPEAARRADPRSVQKRRAIMEAATALFLRQGYQGTSMDEVAGLAGVSKQTVYKHFADKYQLCREIVLDVAGTVDSFVEALAVLQETEELEKDLGALARWYISSVIEPRVLQLRRLVIAEAVHFPELGRTYYEHVPKRSLDALADCLQHLAERKLLQIEAPQLAAHHLAYLVLMIPMDRAMVCGEDEPCTPAELEHFADAAVHVFLAAYGKH